MGPMGAFEQPVGSLGLVSLEPLVASLAAEPVNDNGTLYGIN